MTCRNCKYLKVAPNKAGKIVPNIGYGYQCVVKIKPPVLPDSVTTFFDYSWPPPRRYMSPNGGVSCPLFAARAP